MADETPTDRTQIQSGGPTVSVGTIHGFPTIPGYQIVRELGRGGMGVVYGAKHLSLDRLVAIKLMQRDDGLHQARFLAEGQIIAAVKHPNVVEVFDFGECSVGPYIAMEHLTGGTFSQRLKAGALQPREAAEVIAKIAAGVGAAHDIGIVHRDLKPGNVLLDENGNPKVTDFGLAKRTDFELTLTREAAGTPSYMAPEQARAMKFVGPPADAWSLGVMFYETLTSRKPFVAETDVELLITIQESNPPTLRAITRAIPHDLETICLKCLEKEPERRYATGTELETDLTAWLDGRPISARRATPIERAVLWARRKPYVAAAWALSLLVLLLGGFAIVATNLWQLAEVEKGMAEVLKGQAEEARDAAEREKLRAEAAEKIAERAKDNIADARERLAYSRNIYLAYQEYGSGEVDVVKKLLNLCPEQLRDWEWHYVQRLCHSDLMTLRGHTSTVSSVTFSPDGKYILSASHEGTAKIWSAETGEIVRTLKGHNDVVFSAAYSSDGTHIVTAGSDRSARIWDARGTTQKNAFRPHRLGRTR